MNNSSRSSQPRYQKIKNLGSNLNRSRATYLATDNTTHKSVIIKQFNFAQSNSNLSGFKAYEREIQVLSFLEHPGIPRYLNSFETANGFCIVQEYKNAQSLAVSREFNLEQIKKIAVDCLEILIYLQNQKPPVIHRDIKPENILVDDRLNVYLVDFGFARIGSGEGAVSSVAAGSFGFMAPEQIYNKNLSKSTDLYGLGVTLICLLTGTKSSTINNLISDSGKINFKPRLPTLDPRLIQWLEKIVQPKQRERYGSANEALTALKSLDFTLVPEVHFNQNILIFKSNQLGEKLTQNITITNPVFNTLLEGIWKVEPHPNDPHHRLSSHPWISFIPAQFKSNNIDCSITVDTSKLVASQVYNRYLLLETNSKKIRYNIKLRVHTVKSVNSIFYYPIILFIYILVMIPCFIPILKSLFYLVGYLLFLVLVLAKYYEYYYIQHNLPEIYKSIATLIMGITIVIFINLVFINEYKKIGLNHKLSISIQSIASFLSICLLMGLTMPDIYLFKLVFIFALIGVLFLIILVSQKSKEQINRYRQSIQNRIKS